MAKRVLCVLVAVGCVLGGSLHTNNLTRARRENLKTYYDESFYRTMPAEYGFIAAVFGSFRGLAVDYLWIKAEKLKEARKHYQALQLSRWICKLQPKFPAVWVYMSWNMAWNISVTTYSDEERWLWVYNGLKLLRDEGIPQNPKAMGLYRQLAWIFNNKMGEYADEKHWTYKAKWAWLMQRLLGPPDLSEDRQQAIQRFRPIAEAPETVETLLEDRPDVQPLVQLLAELGIDVWASDDPGLDEHPLETHFFVPFNRAMDYPHPRVVLSARNERRAQAMGERFRSPKVRPAVDVLVAFLRAKVLRERYRMDPAWMLKQMEQFGPLDWRTVDAHAIYWATLGIHKCTDLTDEDEADEINTDRLVAFAIKGLFDRGRLVYEPQTNYVSQAPDPRFIEPMHQIYLGLIEKYNDETYRNGHRNFLHDALDTLWLLDRTEQAIRYFKFLYENYRERDGSPNPIYKDGLEAFLVKRLLEAYPSSKDALRNVSAFLLRSIAFQAGGQTEQSSVDYRRAKRLYDKYMVGAGDPTTGTARMRVFDEVNLPQFDPENPDPRKFTQRTMVRDALEGFLASPYTDALDKARLWELLPGWRQVLLYDAVIQANTALLRNLAASQVDWESLSEQEAEDTLAGIAEDVEATLSEVFPAPEGLDDYRQFLQSRPPLEEPSPFELPGT